MNDKLLKNKNFVVSETILKYIDKDLTINDFIVLLYFINNADSDLNAEKISVMFNLSLEEVMNSISNLMNKNLISLKQVKDNAGRLEDVVSLDEFYKKIISNLDSSIKEDEKLSIFDLISQEFGKKLSPIDCEIINGWLEIGTPEEIIIGALKEASYNGVKTLRYMDKVIYEWNEKGFKTMEDVNNHLNRKDDNKNQEDLFDYNWLEDDDE